MTIIFDTNTIFLFSLQGKASYTTVDGYHALYLDGNSENFATTLPMDVMTRGFAVGAWVKLQTPLSAGMVYGDWSAPYKFALKIDKAGAVHFSIMFRSTNTTTIISNRYV